MGVVCCIPSRGRILAVPLWSFRFSVLLFIRHSLCMCTFVTDATIGAIALYEVGWVEADIISLPSLKVVSLMYTLLHLSSTLQVGV